MASPNDALASSGAPVVVSATVVEGKRREQAGGSGSGDVSEESKPRFKAIAHMVVAMKRFQASINPTYTYGKQQNKPITTTARHVRTPSPTQVLDPEAVLSSPDNGPAAAERMSRASILFRPLPDLADEGQQ